MQKKEPTTSASQAIRKGLLPLPSSLAHARRAPSPEKKLRYPPQNNTQLSAVSKPSKINNHGSTQTSPVVHQPRSRHMKTTGKSNSGGKGKPLK